jgi:hypothetical protein
MGFRRREPIKEAHDGALGGRQETGTKIRLALATAGVEFTNGDQPGVRLTKAAPSRTAESAGASDPVVVVKEVRGKAAKPTTKKR